MHWTYKLNIESDLEQGDILLPNNYLTDVLNKYHPYYISHPDNQLFIVLTQSCDLVRRPKCKSPYITIAPVRPLRVVIETELHHLLKNLSDEANSQPYGSTRVKAMFVDFLSKLFNNNDPRYFFLKKQEDKNIAEDMCAITTLSISIKIEHYAECLNARILQLDDIFQAKLGWLVGQKYSRVGTQDWDESELKRCVSEVIDKAAVWIPEENIKKVDKEILKRKENKPEVVIDLKILEEITAGIKTKKDTAIDAIFELLIKEGYLAEAMQAEIKKLRNKFTSDAVFSSFFK